jgi:hypothetical protein
MSRYSTVVLACRGARPSFDAALSGGRRSPAGRKAVDPLRLNGLQARVDHGVVEDAEK